MKEEPEEGEIVIKGTYTTRSGREVPVEIHTNQHGLIYQRWREELAHRGGVQELKEGEVYQIDSTQYLQKQEEALDIPDSKGRTLLEIFAEEKALDLAKIQLRLDELRKELRHSPNPDPLREEIISLEKKLLGDP